MHHDVIPNSKTGCSKTVEYGKEFKVMISVQPTHPSRVFLEILSVTKCMQDGYKCPSPCEDWAIIIATGMTLTCLMPYVATRQGKQG